MTDEPCHQVVFDDTVWYDNDYALDAEGRLWQLRADWFRSPHWTWYTFGSEEGDTLEPWLKGEWISFGRLVPYTGGPKKPIRKVVVIPVTNEGGQK